MKKFWIIIAAAILFTFSMTSCVQPDKPKEERQTTVESSEGPFQIHYDMDGAMSQFKERPSTAEIGETIELRTEILYDADIHVYVDGIEIGKSHYDSDYWGWSFVMPDREVTVSARFYTKGEIWGGAKETS